MNILPLVMQFFGPVIMNKIAGSLGINSTLAQRAIAAAAPAILAGLIGKVGQAGGAKALSDVIGKQDPGLLGKLGEMVGTGRQASAVEQGTSALGGLLGSGTLAALAGALSKQAGLGAGASNTLLGLMTPAILGTLGREQRSAGLDAAGLANALVAQKKQIADAIPADFAKLLSGTGLLDAVQSSTTPASTPAMPTGATSQPAASTAAMPAAPRTPGKPGVAMPSTALPHHHFSWGPWLVAIAAACALWWSLFGNKALQTQATADIPADVPPSTTLATAPLLPDAVAKTDVGKLIVTILSDTRGAVTGVRDAATAQTALPHLQDIAGRIQKINAEAAKLSPDARRALSTYVTSQSGLLKTAINNVLTLPGVAAILKPVLDQLLGRFDTLAKT